jgi:hypothetical protein
MSSTDQELINRIAVALIREFHGELLDPVLRLMPDAAELLMDLSINPNLRFAGYQLQAMAGNIIIVHTLQTERTTET